MTYLFALAALCSVIFPTQITWSLATVLSDMTENTRHTCDPEACDSDLQKESHHACGVNCPLHGLQSMMSLALVDDLSAVLLLQQKLLVPADRFRSTSLVPDIPPPQV
ncbi:MAG: hypothetical protein AAF984_07010 [Verrucomicrobiota bacterium]